MPVTETKTNKFHPTARNKVLATADVSIQQVQLVDKKGQIRSVVVWRCGPDVFYANNMDGMFDIAQRRRAPEWLLEALSELPADKQFDYTGSQKVVASEDYLPADNEDGPDFVQG